MPKEFESMYVAYNKTSNLEINHMIYLDVFMDQHIIKIIHSPIPWNL